MKKITTKCDITPLNHIWSLKILSFRIYQSFGGQHTYTLKVLSLQCIITTTAYIYIYIYIYIYLCQAHFTYKVSVPSLIYSITFNLAIFWQYANPG